MSWMYSIIWSGFPQHTGRRSRRAHLPLRLVQSPGSIPIGGYYGLLLYIKNTDGTEIWHPAPFTKSTHDWEFTEAIYIPQKDYDYFGVYGKLEDQTGQVWFDDITVRLATAGNALISPYNILQNDSFETPNSTGNWPDYWPSFTDDTVPGVYDVSWIQSTDTLQAFRENRMIRISNVPSWAVVANAILEPLEPGKTYTAYGAVQTENVSGNGAVINIDILGANGVYLSQKSSKALTGTSHGWTILTVSLSESEAKAIDPEAAQIRVSVGTRGATSGTMYFDMVRLLDERAETAYQYTGNYITAITDVLGHTITLDNDARGNIEALTDPKGNTTHFAYDEIDQLKEVTNPVDLRTEYTYDPNNGEAALMHDTEGRLKKTYVRSDTAYIHYKAYNPKGQLTRVYTENNQGTALLHITYEHDPNDNIIRETNQINNSYITYEYDSIDQLTVERYYNGMGTLTKQIQYKYESQYGGLLGNRTESIVTEGGVSTTTIYRYNEANEMILTSVGTYTYDANGNLTQGTNTYVYDAENQLIQILAGSNTIAQYEYNEQGLRTKKTAGSLTEHYYYDQGRLSYITDGSNNLKYFFTRDANGSLLNMIDRTASPHRTYWYVLDARQNVLGLVDGSGQFVVNYQYSGFGEITAATGTITTGDGRLLRDANPFRYASYQYDQESGLYYLKSRYYIPFMGRFLTRDRIPSDNLYVYCRNNPIKYFDPNGYAKELAIAGGIALADGPLPIGDLIAAGILIYVGGKYVVSNWDKISEGVYEAWDSVTGFFGTLFAADAKKTVSEILKTKRGNIKNAPLPPGSPKWEEILTLTLAEIQRRAKKGDIGFRTIYKLLTDRRFNR